MRNAPLALTLFAFIFSLRAFAQIPPGAVASNVQVVGYSEVDGRPGWVLRRRMMDW
jgi:hypothetical protein